MVVDMRGSKWESVKPVLRTLQESFSSSIHTALLIKPDTFWQKHKTNLGSAKLSFEVSLAAAQLIGEAELIPGPASVSTAKREKQNCSEMKEIQFCFCCQARSVQLN